MIGEIRFKRRRYITPNGSAVSPPSMNLWDGQNTIVTVF